MSLPALCAACHTHVMSADAAPASRWPLAAILTGGLLVLTAWALATTSTYSESATYCPSVLGRDLVSGSADQNFCSPFIADRERLVLILAAVGPALIVIGAVLGRSALFARSSVGGSVTVPSRIALAALGLMTLVFAVPHTVVALWLSGAIGREWDDVLRATFPVGIAAAAMTVAVLASLLGRRGHRLGIDHAMAAVSLAAPLLALILIDADGLGVTRHALIDPAWTDAPARYVVCGVPVALALLAVTSMQNRGLVAPAAGVSGIVLLASASALFLAMVPEAFGAGWGGQSDQSIGRFALFVLAAILLPLVMFASWWALHSTDRAAPTDAAQGSPSILA